MAQVPPLTNTGAPSKKNENKKFPKLLNYPKPIFNNLNPAMLQFMVY